jgi:CRISPR-associated protein Cas2
MAMTVLAAYDISRDDRRARVAAYLQTWGERLQRSVFVCTVASAELPGLQNRLADMVDPDTDAVHILPTCIACWSQLSAIGQADRAPEKPYWIVL